VRAADLDLDLEVFAGPFDLLMTVVLREEISLAEVELGEIVIAYLEHVEEQGDLDLEAATEFLVLIASLLELKSRLLLPAPEEERVELGPEEAADELLARMLEYRRYRDAAARFAELFADGRRYHYRSAPLPSELRRVALDAARPAYDPAQLAASIGDLLRIPPTPDTSHIRPTVSLEKRLRVLSDLLRSRRPIDFD
jgi:segregation and condensation protein A